MAPGTEAWTSFAQDVAELIHVDRLANETCDAGKARLVHVRGRSEDVDRHARGNPCLPQMFPELIAIHVPELEIEKDETRAMLAKQAERLVAFADQVNGKAVGMQDVSKEWPEVLIVLDQHHTPLPSHRRVLFPHRNNELQ